MKNYVKRITQMQDDLRTELTKELNAKRIDLKVDLYMMDLDAGLVAFEGTVFYEKFAVYMMGSLTDDGAYEIDSWTFDTEYTGNDAAYFYNMVCLLEKVRPERCEATYEGFIQIKE